MPNATPRPWYTNDASGNPEEVCSEANGRHSCVARAHLDVDDARLIVRAVNAHDDLLSAFRELYANTENRQDEPFVAYVRKTCAAALRAAGEGG